VEVAKGRRRKKPVKVDVKETSGGCGEAGPPAAQVDTVTDTIEAVLADALAFAAAVEKPKKSKRAKKRDQQGNVAKTPKQDAETVADEVEENDDDSSTAGNEGCHWLLL